MRAGRSVGEGGREESLGANPLIRESGPWRSVRQQLHCIIVRMLMVSVMTKTMRMSANLDVKESI